MDRAVGSEAQAAMGTAIRLLREGKLLGIYPEGTRSPDGRLYKGKTGVARMALEAGVPVIPVAVIGTNKLNPIGSRMWRPHHVHIRIGEPLDFSRYAGMAGDRFIERSMTDEIMYALMELSGQTYVDVYAASVKERAAADAAGCPTRRRLMRGAADHGRLTAGQRRPIGVKPLRRHGDAQLSPSAASSAAGSIAARRFGATVVGWPRPATTAYTS